MLRTCVSWLGVALTTALPLAIQAQTATVTGTVTAAGEGGPLIGVSVVIVGTSRGAVTGDNGRYTITRVNPGTVTVEARRIGLVATRKENIRVTADGPNVVDFALQASVLRLQSVVTTGVVDPVEGVKVPFTVAKLTQEDLPVPSSGSAAGMVMGKVAGANIIPGRGPNAGVQIQLRTPTSQFKSTSPMFIVDGVVLSQAFGSTTADIDNLDIVSIEVIKGAAASSLYGSRAANGVVSITTNRGNQIAMGTTQIRVRSEMGQNRVANFVENPKYHYFQVNEGAQYVDANGVTVRPFDYVDDDGNKVDRALRESPSLSSTFMDNPYLDPLYDHGRQFFRPNMYMSNNISVQRNSQGTNFSVGFTRFTDPGILDWNDGVTRNTARLNLDHRIKENLLLTLSTQHARSFEDVEPVSFTEVSQLNPDVDLRAPGDGYKGFPYRIIPDSTSSITNPFYDLWRNNRVQRRTRTFINSELTYTPLDWLSLNAAIGYDRSDRGDDDFLERGLIDDDGEGIEVGSIERNQNFTDSFNGQLSSTFLQAFGGLTLRTTLRGLLEAERSQNLEARGTDFTSSGVRRVEATLNQFGDNEDEERRAVSGLISTAADYEGKYIVDLLYRYDGNSLFGPANRWNGFYRVAGAYLMSEEPWWPVADLSLVKVRLAQGTGGTRPNFLDQYEAQLIETGGGIVRRALGNPLLRPEVSRETELALETIYKNRISLQLTQVWNKTHDNIIGIAVPALSGYNTQEYNAGSIEASTFEVTLQAQVIQRQNFRWEVNVVGDRSRNRVTEFNRPCYGDGLLLRCNNEVLGKMRGGRHIETFDDLLPDARALSSQFDINDDGYVVWVGEGNTWKDGVAKNLWGTSTEIGNIDYVWGAPVWYRDPLSRNITDDEIIGDSNPWASFGFGNTVQWGGFTFYGLFVGQFGGSIYNDRKHDLYNSADHPDVVQVGKPDELKKPVAYYTAYLVDAVGYEKHFVEEATFAKLSEASIAYRVPASALNRFSRLGLDGARFELVGRNLFTLTKYSGYDPLSGTQLRRVEALDYPQYRTFTGVVQLTF